MAGPLSKDEATSAVDAFLALSPGVELMPWQRQQLIHLLTHPEPVTCIMFRSPMHPNRNG